MERAGAGRLACRAVHRRDVGVGEGRISGKFLHFDEAWGTQEDPLAGERLSELIERAVERSLRQARTPNRVVPGETPQLGPRVASRDWVSGDDEARPVDRLAHRLRQVNGQQRNSEAGGQSRRDRPDPRRDPTRDDDRLRSRCPSSRASRTGHPSRGSRNGCRRSPKSPCSVRKPRAAGTICRTQSSGGKQTEHSSVSLRTRRRRGTSVPKRAFSSEREPGHGLVPPSCGGLRLAVRALRPNTEPLPWPP